MLLYQPDHVGQTVQNLLFRPSPDAFFLYVDHGYDVLMLPVYHPIIIPKLVFDAALRR